jgi:hypothetical protein
MSISKRGPVSGAKIQSKEKPAQSVPTEHLTARQCAILVLHLIRTKEAEPRAQKVTRTRLSEATLRALWDRSRLGTEFIHEVQEWLFLAGWVLFFAGKNYAVIKKDAVEGWMRISSKRLANDIADIQRDQFEWSDCEDLLVRTIDDADGREEGE